MSEALFGTTHPLLPPLRHLSQIGRIAAIWSQIESSMEVIILGLYEIDLGRGLVFTANLGFAARITMLHMLCDGGVEDAALAKELKAILPRVERASGERNEVVHAIWGKSDKPGHILRMHVRVKGHKLTTVQKDYSAEDLIAIGDRLFEVLRDLADLTTRLRALEKSSAAPKHSRARK